MKLYNTLSKKVEEFVPLNPPEVGMYTCGPTVYDYTHLGHGRKYIGDDLLKRVLNASGFKVKHVMNITDVGHLVSDSDEGEDKMEKGAKKMGKTVWEVAQFYTDYFEDVIGKLNIQTADITCKATDHINEQIELIKKLIDKGFAYDTPEAVYFEVDKFADYTNLFGQNLTDKAVAVREQVQEGEHKKAPADFALWFKRTGRFADHTMHWDSPWGDGFPGWHIECSAMSMKYLGEQFDIHTGGEDHLPIHHPNEIAQSEAATGKKPFVKYWLHYAFLKVDGQKMSKSKGNYLRVEDLEAKGYDPLALRYLFLTTHYRKVLNFTLEGLTAAQTALNRLRSAFGVYKSAAERTQLSPDKLAKVDDFRARFKVAVEDDLNFPEALAVIWEMVKSNIPDYDKFDLLRAFDEVLGLDLATAIEVKVEIPLEVEELVERREAARKTGDFAESDKLRQEVADRGFTILDTPAGPKIEQPAS